MALKLNLLRGKPMDTTDVSYLVNEADQSVLKNLAQMGQHLKQLKDNLAQKEAELAKAKKEYEHYASNILPSVMYSAGVESLKLQDGHMLNVKRAYYCSPNKNAEDKKTMADWLIANGGEHLIKRTITAGEDSVAALKEAGIPFAEDTSVNTSSLKAFLKDKLGITSGAAQLQLDDIPKCMHFSEVTVAEIE